MSVSNLVLLCTCDSQKELLASLTTMVLAVTNRWSVQHTCTMSVVWRLQDLLLRWRRGYFLRTSYLSYPVLLRTWFIIKYWWVLTNSVVTMSLCAWRQLISLICDRKALSVDWVDSDTSLLLVLGHRIYDLYAYSVHNIARKMLHHVISCLLVVYFAIALLILATFCFSPARASSNLVLEQRTNSTHALHIISQEKCYIMENISMLITLVA